MPARILLYGRDAFLLQTRCGVLESAGFRVCVAMTQPEVEQFLLSGQIALLILCHTLTAEECRRARRSVQKLNAGMKTVLLAGNRSEGPQMGLYDGVFEAFQGPGALIATVERVLGRNAPILFPS